MISAQLKEVNESPELKEQIAQVLREADRQRFGADPEPSSSAKRPDRSYTKPVDDLDDLPSSELDELEERFGQELEITPEGETRLKGNEKQERERKERLEKEAQGKEKIGKVDEQERERQRAVTKEIEREKRKAREQEELERLSREKKEAKAAKETNPKKVDEKNLQRMFPIGSMLLMGVLRLSAKSIDCPSDSRTTKAIPL